MWHDLFALGIPVAEKIIRPVIVYLFLILGLRLGGKRELAQLTPFDLVVLLTLSNAVQNAIIGEDNSVTGGLIGAATLLAVNHFVVRYAYTHETIERLVEGNAIALIKGGRVQRERLQAELITEQELLSAAHKQGFSSLTEVDQAILEPGGTLSFFGKEPSGAMARHRELLAEIRRLSARVEALAPPPRAQG